MFFSVIIPTFNRIGLLQDALASVLAQTFIYYEIIVVDDGSTDGTREWLRTQGDRLLTIAQPNRGAGAARNAGAKKARGQYLAFLDSDDLWLPWSLATFAEAIERHCGPAVLSSSLAVVTHQSELDKFTRKAVHSDAFPDYFSSHRMGYFVGAGMSVLRRDVFLLTGGFDENFSNCEDHDLILRLGTAPGFVQVQSPVTLAYRKHPGAVTAHLDRTIAGCMQLIQRERTGSYPGKRCRAAQRQEILSLHARPLALECARCGFISEAWQLYWATFQWNLRLGKLKFLLAFPALILLHVMRAWLRMLGGPKAGQA